MMPLLPLTVRGGLYGLNGDDALSLVSLYHSHRIHTRGFDCPETSEQRVFILTAPLTVHQDQVRRLLALPPSEFWDESVRRT